MILLPRKNLYINWQVGVNTENYHKLLRNAIEDKQGGPLSVILLTDKPVANISNRMYLKQGKYVVHIRYRLFSLKRNAHIASCLYSSLRLKRFSSQRKRVLFSLLSANVFVLRFTSPYQWHDFTNTYDLLTSIKARSDTNDQRECKKKI
jgi:hypothetical protein